MIEYSLRLSLHTVCDDYFFYAVSDDDHCPHLRGESMSGFIPQEMIPEECTATKIAEAIFKYRNEDPEPNLLGDSRGIQ